MFNYFKCKTWIHVNLLFLIAWFNNDRKSGISKFNSGSSLYYWVTQSGYPDVLDGPQFTEKIYKQSDVGALFQAWIPSGSEKNSGYGDFVPFQIYVGDQIRFEGDEAQVYNIIESFFFTICSTYSTLFSSSEKCHVVYDYAEEKKQVVKLAMKADQQKIQEEKNKELNKIFESLTNDNSIANEISIVSKFQIETKETNSKNGELFLTILFGAIFIYLTAVITVLLRKLA